MGISNIARVAALVAIVASWLIASAEFVFEGVQSHRLRPIHSVSVEIVQEVITLFCVFVFRAWVYLGEGIRWIMLSLSSCFRSEP